MTQARPVGSDAFCPPSLFRKGVAALEQSSSPPTNTLRCHRAASAAHARTDPACARLPPSLSLFLPLPLSLPAVAIQRCHGDHYSVSHVGATSRSQRSCPLGVRSRGSEDQSCGRVMQEPGVFVGPFPAPRRLAAAAAGAKARLTHPGKAILAGKFLLVCDAEQAGEVEERAAPHGFMDARGEQSEKRKSVKFSPLNPPFSQIKKKKKQSGGPHLMSPPSNTP